MPSDLNSSVRLSAPWAAFLDELNTLLPEPVELHCIGGFVSTVLYGVPRVTADVDYVAVLPQVNLEAIAGRGSVLARKHKVYLRHVGIISMPEDYALRLVPLFPERFERLLLYAPDPYDLILSKLERNNPKDRDEEEYLAKRLKLNPQVLRERYELELRPYLSNESRHDLTLKIWSEYFPRPGS